MTEPKFTPGPWKIVKDGHEGTIISIRDKHRNWIGECNYALVGDESMYGHPIITEREALANAHLISAAPEMYEALQVACQHIQEWDACFQMCDKCFITQTLRKAREESEESI